MQKYISFLSLVVSAQWFGFYLKLDSANLIKISILQNGKSHLGTTNFPVGYHLAVQDDSRLVRSARLFTFAPFIALHVKIKHMLTHRCMTSCKAYNFETDVGFLIV